MANPDARDAWDEAWEAYEARRSESAPAARFPPEASTRQRPAIHQPLGGWLRAIALLILGFALGSLAQPLVAMAGLLLWRDGAGLVTAIELRSDAVAVPPPMRRPTALAVLGGDEAGHFLAGLAGTVSEGWRDPAALRRVILARRDVPAVRGPALQPLERVRGLHALGWGVVRLEVGPAYRPGGLGLDLAWRGGTWQVTRLALLEASPPPG